MLRKEGILVGWVSNRPFCASAAAPKELKIDFLVQTKGGKVEKVENLLAQTGF